MTGILEALGLPADLLLRGARTLLGVVTWFGDPPDLGAVLVLAALLLRLVTLPLWARALPGRRFEAVCAPVVRTIRRGGPGDAGAVARAGSDLLARFRFSWRIAHAAVAVVAVNSTACLLWAAHLNGETSVYTASFWTLGDADVGWWRTGIAIVFAALGWYYEWYAEERRILTHLMPEWVWNEQSARRSRLLSVGVPLLWALLLLPFGALAFLLVWQLAARVPTAAFTSRAGPVEPPVPAQPEHVPPPTGPAPEATPAAPTPPVQTPLPPHTPPGPRPSLESPVSRPPQAQPLGGGDPQTIDGYHLLGRLGRGGMGTVYLAHRDGSATHVALKAVHTELTDEPELVRRFEREAEVLQLVDGEYTARILDSGLDGDRPYIVMELLDGLPLGRYVADHGPIEDATTLRALAIAVASALSALHKRDIVHRDIKPSNIMLTSAGPKLVDFGIVRMLDATRHTPADQAMGTLAYMAPEQYDPKLPVGPAADVWAWACTIVHAATGESPFDATDLPAVMNAVLERDPDPGLLARVHAIDSDLSEVVSAALSRDIADRPPDGTALLARLSPDGTDSHTVISKVNAGWSTLR